MVRRLLGGGRREKGAAAEDRVDRAARARGWKPLARNYTVRGGELDLVYRADRMLVVVEVRYRSHAGYGRAAASVTAGKQRRIVWATRHFLMQHPDYARLPLRFDVVGLDADAPDQLDWIENAFYAE